MNNPLLQFGIDAITKNLNSKVDELKDMIKSSVFNKVNTVATNMVKETVENLQSQATNLAAGVGKVVQETATKKIEEMKNEAFKYVKSTAASSLNKAYETAQKSVTGMFERVIQNPFKSNIKISENVQSSEERKKEESLEAIGRASVNLISHKLVPNLVPIRPQINFIGALNENPIRELGVASKATIPQYDSIQANQIAYFNGIELYYDYKDRLADYFKTLKWTPLANNNEIQKIFEFFKQFEIDYLQDYLYMQISIIPFIYLDFSKLLACTMQYLNFTKKKIFDFRNMILLKNLDISNLVDINSSMVDYWESVSKFTNSSFASNFLDLTGIYMQKTLDGVEIVRIEVVENNHKNYTDYMLNTHNRYWLGHLMAIGIIGQMNQQEFNNLVWYYDAVNTNTGFTNKIQVDEDMMDIEIPEAPKTNVQEIPDCTKMVLNSFEKKNLNDVKLKGVSIPHKIERVVEPDKITNMDIDEGTKNSLSFDRLNQLLGRLFQYTGDTNDSLAFMRAYSKNIADLVFKWINYQNMTCINILPVNVKDKIKEMERGKVSDRIKDIQKKPVKTPEDAHVIREYEKIAEKAGNNVKIKVFQPTSSENTDIGIWYYYDYFDEFDLFTPPVPIELPIEITKYMLQIYLDQYHNFLSFLEEQALPSALSKVQYDIMMEYSRQDLDRIIRRLWHYPTLDSNIKTIISGEEITESKIKQIFYYYRKNEKAINEEFEKGKPEEEIEKEREATKKVSSKINRISKLGMLGGLLYFVTSFGKSVDSLVFKKSYENIQQSLSIPDFGRKIDTGKERVYDIGLIKEGYAKQFTTEDVNLAGFESIEEKKESSMVEESKGDDGDDGEGGQGQTKISPLFEKINPKSRSSDNPEFGASGGSDGNGGSDGSDNSENMLIDIKANLLTSKNKEEFENFLMSEQWGQYTAAISGGMIYPEINYLKKARNLAYNAGQQIAYAGGKVKEFITQPHIQKTLGSAAKFTINQLAKAKGVSASGVAGLDIITTIVNDVIIDKTTN